MMYDTETDSLWHQISGESRQGDFVGQQLAELPEGSWSVHRYGDWLKEHPETLVLTCAHCEGHGEATGTIDELHAEKAAADGVMTDDGATDDL